MITETEILTHALVGYEAQRDEIERRIEDLQRRLAGGAEAGGAEVAAPEARPAKKKRRLSAAGRAAIVAAAKKRWAKARRGL